MIRKATTPKFIFICFGCDVSTRKKEKRRDNGPSSRRKEKILRMWW